MIDFQDWLRQIQGYGNLILDADTLSAAWLHGDRTKTSVTDFAELYEQIFDDLAADEMALALPQRLPHAPGLQAAVIEFLAALRSVDREVAAKGDIPQYEILSSAAWQRVRHAAEELRKAGS